MHRHFIILLLLLFTPMSSFALGPSLYLGAGAFFQNMGRVTSSNDASTSLLGQTYLPTVNLSFHTNIFGQTIAPSIYYTPLAKKEVDGVTKKILIVTLPLLFDLFPMTQLKAGVGALFYTVTGAGGSTELNNGSSTREFFYPSGSQGSRKLITDVGLGIDLELFRIDLDIMIINTLSSNRAVNSTLSLGVPLL